MCKRATEIEGECVCVCVRYRSSTLVVCLHNWKKISSRKCGFFMPSSVIISFFFFVFITYFNYTHIHTHTYDSREERAQETEREREEIERARDRESKRQRGQERERERAREKKNKGQTFEGGFFFFLTGNLLPRSCKFIIRKLHDIFKVPNCFIITALQLQ